MSATPFDDFRDLVNLVPGRDATAVAAFRERDAQLTKIPGSLGRLEEIVELLAAHTGRIPPRVEKPLVAVFAANHGITAKGVSAFPAEVTKQMVANYAAGGAAINQICLSSDLGLKVFELALDYPTPDVSETDAFDEAGCAATMAFGMEALAGGHDLVCLGEMGIGNTAIASAIYLAIFGGSAEEWVGPGTGVAGPALANKAEVVGEAVARIAGEKDPFEILRRLGGREIAAMVVHFIGAFITQGLLQKPVFADAPGCRSRIGGRRIAHRKHQGAAGMLLQADKQGGKVRIARKNDKFVKMGGVRKVIHTVHDQMDISAGFAPCGQGRAVHHLKGAADKGIAVFLVSLGVQVAHAL